MVERSGRKSCGVFTTPSKELRVGRLSIFSTFAIGRRSEMGRKKRGLPGVGTGITLANFQIEGRLASRRERLEMYGTKHLQTKMLKVGNVGIIRAGAVKFPELEISSETWRGVKITSNRREGGWETESCDDCDSSDDE